MVCGQQPWFWPGCRKKVWWVCAFQLAETRHLIVTVWPTALVVAWMLEEDAVGVRVTAGMRHHDLVVGVWLTALVVASMLEEGGCGNKVDSGHPDGGQHHCSLFCCVFLPTERVQNPLCSEYGVICLCMCRALNLDRKSSCQPATKCNYRRGQCSAQLGPCMHSWDFAMHSCHSWDHAMHSCQ